MNRLHPGHKEKKMPFVQVRFPKGVQAKAEVSGFEILTDQSVEDGGHGEAPT